MSKVISLDNDNDLNNIPHMLRVLASSIESGEHMKPMNMLVVAVYDGNYYPQVYGFGEGKGMLADIGALQCAINFLSEAGNSDE